MKNLFFTVLLVAIYATQSFAQIEVGTNNNVAIGISDNVLSKLSVGTTGSISWTGYFKNTSTASSGQGALIGVGTKPINNSYWALGTYGSVSAGYGKTIGVKGVSYNSSAQSNGRSYGVYALAGNALSGYNYGVWGYLYGSNNGAGIFGTTISDTYVDGKYAGYFYGDTKVNGDLWVTGGGTYDTSDKKAKKQIKDLDKNNIEKLKKVKAIKFKYKTPTELGLIDSETADSTSNEAAETMTAMYDAEHIGLIAQEVQEVYPELVKEDQSGYLGVNYTGLIPVLIEAIKEQQATIDDLIKEVEKLKKN